MTEELLSHNEIKKDAIMLHTLNILGMGILIGVAYLVEPLAVENGYYMIFPFAALVFSMPALLSLVEMTSLILTGKGVFRERY